MERHNIAIKALQSTITAIKLKEEYGRIPTEERTKALIAEIGLKKIEAEFANINKGPQEGKKRLPPPPLIDYINDFLAADAEFQIKLQKLSDKYSHLSEEQFKAVVEEAKYNYNNKVNTNI